MNNRRNFLLAGAAAVSAVPFLGQWLIAQEEQDEDAIGIQNLPREQVLDFVRNAHTSLETTKQLLKKEPRLLRATWEWAPGDFESAIGAAAHSGAVEIVEFLLSKGASYSVFTAAVLGHLDSVTAIIEQSPALINCRGPHDIPLLAHAVAGGDKAKKVVEYLEKKGAVAEEKWEDLKIDESLANFTLGDYAMTRGERTLSFSVVRDADELYADFGERGKKRLLYQGQTRFNLEGTPSELNFERTKSDQKHCQRVLLKEGFPVGFAVRKPDEAPSK